MEGINQGDRVSILVAGGFSKEPTHEVTGFWGSYILICPIGKLDQIKPGQQHVPVSRITSERVKVR